MDIFCWGRIGLVFLLSPGLQAQSKSPVCDAVHKGHAVGHEQDGVDAVREALAAGGDVNERDQAGWTPIMHAALECRAQILDLLLEHGAQVNVRSETTKTHAADDGRNAPLAGLGSRSDRRARRRERQRSRGTARD